MKHKQNHVKTLAAFGVALTAFVSLFFLRDSTPLLVEPRPDLDWPLGLLGFAAGLWSAIHITKLPYTPERKIGRIALWITLPLYLSFGLPVIGERTHEALSFRRGSLSEAVTMLVADKRRGTTRRGRVFHEVTLSSPGNDREVILPIAQTTFDRVKPQRECVTIAAQRAPNGAVRLLRPVYWKVRCPWSSQ